MSSRKAVLTSKTALKTTLCHAVYLSLGVKFNKMAVIRTAATEVVLLFRSCGAKLQETTTQSAALGSLNDSHGRFRLWSGNLGVFQDGHASLDWRLRGSSITMRNVLGLIGDLNDDLSESI